MILFLWFPNAKLVDENNKVFYVKRTLPFYDALTVANVVILSINLIALFIRRGLGQGFYRFFKGTFQGMRYYNEEKWNKKTVRRSELEMKQYYEKLREQKNKQPEIKDKYTAPVWKTTASVFLTLVLVACISEIILIPFIIN
ncbi:hypothetical protein [[Mycoplasma] gypis]|uniref:DUF3899 domain-containing protein n=1 Tax=[Mycoplasma] gypis TaxID=92404 RepID=A0ABZ2RLZ6_9BACT|nr:hypothetical protein [[Mycoplasma] gypis]MBN0919236.1 hypothetical protein [[Mycoplasma] gypis]